MKFHNQRSFMGHEISNVNNKPLLHKKGKQWIVVAVSALILAGFGGMVSTTTHADTANAQPTMTKVAPKPATNPARSTTPAPSTNNNPKPTSVKPATPKATQPNTKNIDQQATDLHKNLVNNSINNSNNNHKPKSTTLGLSSPATLRTNPTIQTQGNWTNSTATWTLDSQGNLVVHGNGSGSVLNHSSDNGHDLAEELGLVGNKATTQSVKTLSFDGNISAPNDAHRLFDDEEFDNNGTNLKSYDFTNLYQIDLSGLNMSNTHTYWAMFGGLKGLTNVIGFKNLPTDADVQWLFCDDPSLTTVDLSQAVNIPNDYWMFLNDPKLQSIILGPNMRIDKNAFINNPSPNNTSENVPASQQTWTDLNGTPININNPNEYLTNDTWNAGNVHKATDTIIYKNVETGNSDTAQIVPANNDYHSDSIQPPVNTDYGYITGPYGATPQFDWTNYGIHTISDRNNSALNVLYNDNVAFDWQALPNQSVPTINGGTYVIMIKPNPTSAIINYYDGNNKLSSYTFNGDVNVTGATNATFDASSHEPAGYHIVGKTTFTFSNMHNPTTVQVASDEDYLNYYVNDNNIIGSTKNSPISINSNIKGVQNNHYTFTIPLSYSVDLPTGYHIVKGDGISNSANNNDGLTFNHQNGTHKVLVQPNTITVNYKNGTQNISSSTTSYTSNSKTYDNFAMPSGYQLASDQSNNPLSFNNNGDSVDVKVTPIQKTDTINYMNGSHRVSSASFTGNEAVGTTSFTVSAPSNYSLSSGAQSTFDYNGSSYSVSVVPNKVTNTIYYEGSNGYSYSSSSNVSGLYSASGSVSAPYGYHYINGNGNFTYGVNASASHTFNVAPNSASETIKYIYNNGSKNFNEGSTVMSGYYHESSNANGTSGLSSGYQLVTKNNSFTYSNGNASLNVNVKPLSASADVLYQNNSKTISSHKFNGNDYRATDAGSNTFSINNYFAPGLPKGYHITSDLTQTFNIDDNSHDVSVAPNQDTDTVNYQINGHTLTSQQFSGNDEHATQAGNNSFDVDANDDTNIPNGYELVKSDNTFKFNKGTHDVAIQPIPQPTPAPYIPSMPTSVASNAGSVAYIPASVSSTISKPSNEATPVHYRYAKVVTPLQLHTSKHFTNKNGVLTIKHPTSFKIMKIVHDHKLTRYEVKYQGHNYFVTANDHFTINNYVQKHDFKSHKHMMVKVITPMIEYKHAHFSKKNAIRVFKKGAVLPVKKVFTIGKGEMTRFELTNGRYVTSNKLFVKVIK